MIKQESKREEKEMKKLLAENMKMNNQLLA